MSDSLAADKRTIRAKLKQFEDDFARKHGRKPESRDVRSLREIGSCVRT